MGKPIVSNKHRDTFSHYATSKVLQPELFYSVAAHLGRQGRPNFPKMLRLKWEEDDLM